MAKASLVELEAVTAVARSGGFRAAARDLGMSSSALSHAIAALEERLGVRLFNRTTRSVALSAAGEQFVAEIAPAMAVIDCAIENVGEHAAEPSGTLRLNTSLGAARMLLTPLSSKLLNKVDARIIRSCIELGWAEPWFNNPLKPDWLICKLTEAGRRLASA